MESFEAVFAEHAPFVVRVLRRFGVAERDLPDASQDVFVVVHRKLAGFEGRSSLRTWLYRITHRVAADYRKRAHRRYEALGARLPDTRAPDDPTRELCSRQLVDHLERALARLKPDKRHVFVLYELEQLSMQEVAEIVGCPLKTAFSRLYAARREVQSSLRARGVAAVAVLPLEGAGRWMQLAEPQLAQALAGGEGAARVSVELVLQAGALAAPKTAAVAVPTWSVVTAVAVAAAVAGVPVLQTLEAPAGAQIAQLGASAELAEALLEGAERLRFGRFAAVATAAEAGNVERSRTSASTSTSRRARAMEVGGEQWIEAPEPVLQARTQAPGSSAVGLDEVLSVTSVRSDMRLGLRDRSRDAWALVPRKRLDVFTAGRSDGSPPAGSSRARRASTHR